eukprot:353435-Chlamydomonas_euryale.AAC.10
MEESIMPSPVSGKGIRDSSMPSRAHDGCRWRIQLADASQPLIPWSRTSLCKILGAVKYVSSGGFSVGACRELWAIGPQEVAIWGAMNYTIRVVHWPIQ